MPMATTELAKNALGAIARFALGLAALIILPSWSLSYWQGWAVWVLFVACCLAVTLYLLRRDPALVARRMRSGAAAQRDPTQKLIMRIASVLFTAIFTLSCLDHRFGWSSVPVAIVIVGDGLIVLGFVLVAAVFRANSFASATIEVSADQKVVSSGPYAIVRHPMYAGALPLIAGIPLGLGSYWGLAIVVLVVGAIVWRLLNEERYLARHLPGYQDYCRKVRWRLAPGIW
jgi:protein-S-isoprenylcysteine O-methyltransferase Ste14